ncbi:Uncharacterized protein SSS_07305 [Sarcoptes scabiei]|uniref:KIAA1143-like protein n=1 Tax=Sarcoptes scabiei TaxID=52283 RepID=A0A132ADK2_SARSC|nr:Uncharacterized protein SSS_07305 [Sarcoptes scabiei]KPM08645.1 KIAA1143-like protein [Sarcoptes scabiei]
MAHRKRNIQFSKPEEPAFLKKIKSQMGIQKDLVTIDTKKEKLDKKSLEYRDEEPVYLLDTNSDITEKELETFKKKIEKEKEYAKDEEVMEQKIIFKKPDKKQTKNSNDFSQNNSLSKKKHEEVRAKIQENRNKIKTIKNSSLLSFDADEEEEE